MTQDLHQGRRAIRGRVLTFVDDPATVGEAASHHYHEDGIVVVENGRIVARGDSASVLPTLAAETVIDDYSGCFVVPGFIDTHIHYPQSGIVASFGTQLLEWLEKYTFPEEQRFADRGYAERTAKYFLDELLRNGTTTAAVYCTVHEQSAEAFFTESQRRNTRMIAGKVMMDRNAPEALRDDATQSYEASRRLLRKWHGNGRQLYAVTPRFALTSTPEQLEAAGSLIREFPDCYLQTHLSENRDEVAAAANMYPDAANYTDIYDRAGLLGSRSIFGHGIHLDGTELRRLHDTRSVIAFCPSSNLFMGSGLFDLAKTTTGERPVRVGLASDIGAGTSFSMLRTAHDAYKVLQLLGQNLTALRAIYTITLGNARALSLDHLIGSLEPGFEADIAVVDPTAMPALRHRVDTIEGDMAAELFATITLGDDRCVRATYVAGEPV
ncbi:MAG: guanine deaminase [Sphingomonadales bacterium]